MLKIVYWTAFPSRKEFGEVGCWLHHLHPGTRSFNLFRTSAPSLPWSADISSSSWCNVPSVSETVPVPFCLVPCSGLFTVSCRLRCVSAALEDLIFDLLFAPFHCPNKFNLCLFYSAFTFLPHYSCFWTIIIRPGTVRTLSNFSFVFSRISFT
jgi:hypothetical protein